MSKLEKLIKEWCPDGVEYRTLGEISENHDRKRKAITKNKRKSGVYPYYGASGIVDYVEEYIFDGEYLLVSEDGANLLVRNTPIAFSISGKNWVNNHAHVLAFEYVEVRKYIEIYLNSIDLSKYISTAAQPKLTQESLNSIEVPFPPLPVQREIVRILDNFTELTAELTAELVARKQQYEYYRDSLLNLEGVAWRELDEIATDMYRGAGIKRDEVSEEGNPCVRYGEIYTKYGISFDECFSRTKVGTKTFEHGDILFAITGESVEEISKSCVYMGHETCYAGGDIVVMKHKQNPKYIAYALSTTNAQMQKSKGKIKSKVVHSSIPALKKITIPIPSLEEQNRIVNILDRFDTLCNDITTGIPAEIEARKQQYEYYRDKLLSF